MRLRPAAEGADRALELARLRLEQANCGQSSENEGFVETSDSCGHPPEVAAGSTRSD